MKYSTEFSDSCGNRFRIKRETFSYSSRPIRSNAKKSLKTVWSDCRECQARANAHSFAVKLSIILIPKIFFSCGPKPIKNARAGYPYTGEKIIQYRNKRPSTSVARTTKSCKLKIHFISYQISRHKYKTKFFFRQVVFIIF